MEMILRISKKAFAAQVLCSALVPAVRLDEIYSEVWDPCDAAYLFSSVEVQLVGGLYTHRYVSALGLLHRSISGIRSGVADLLGWPRPCTFGGLLYTLLT